MQEKLNHKSLLNLLLRRFSRGDIRLWNAQTAFAYNKEGKVIGKMGKDGQADLTGIMNVGGIGIRLEIEGKVGKDQQRREQKIFETVITNHGGLYILAWGEDDVEEAIRVFLTRYKAHYDCESGRIYKDVST